MTSITALNDLARQLIHDDPVSSGIFPFPLTKEYVEKMIAEETEYQAGDKIAFLPTARLNNVNERTACVNVIKDVIESGAFTRGPYIQKVEQYLQEIYQADYCIVTSSGTDAIKIALKSLEIGVGDEVITPPNSFAATENAILAVGAKPVYANIDSSHNMDPSDIAKRITSRTKAILPVCLYGSTKNIKAIYQVAKAQGLAVVIDAAQCFAIPSIMDWADMITLSFNPFKNIGTFGKSGALVTRSEAIGKRARQYSYHGFVEGKKNIKAIDWGYNSRMDNMQAAVLDTKLAYFGMNALKRCYLAQRYLVLLSDLEKDNKVTLPIERSENTWHLFPILLPSSLPSELMEFAKTHEVELDIYYPILSHHASPAYFSNYPGKAQLKASEIIHAKLIHLPVHNHMSLEEQNRIVEVVYAFFQSAPISRI